MPEKAVLLGTSNRTHHEIWTMTDQVLCFQSSPEVNIAYIKELIINKSYENGQILDDQKNQCLHSIEEQEPHLLRHLIMKCITNFLKMANEPMITMMKNKLAKL